MVIESRREENSFFSANYYSLEYNLSSLLLKKLTIYNRREENPKVELRLTACETK